jgi:hypothetical protein
VEHPKANGSIIIDENHWLLEPQHFLQYTCIQFVAVQPYVAM